MRCYSWARPWACAQPPVSVLRRTAPKSALFTIADAHAVTGRVSDGPAETKLVEGTQSAGAICATAQRTNLLDLSTPQTHFSRVNWIYQPRYSLSTLSAHATSATKSLGVTKRAFFPSMSDWATARASEQAVHM